MTRFRLFVLVIFLALGISAAAAAQPARNGATTAENVIVITIDGLRWQEVYGGADPAILQPSNKAIPNLPVLRLQYWRETPEARRERLMPFLWNVVVKQGQIFGDRESNSVATITNPLKFSYPGYSELLCGFVDPRINSNDDIPNPNVTVLEWLHKQPGFDGKVAAFSMWDRLHAIVNPARSGIFVMAGWRPIESFRGQPLTDREHLINEMLKQDTRHWPDAAPDVYCEAEAIEFFKARKPRVMYVMLGETDEWAHANRYDLYLQSAERSDAFIRRLWELVQATPSHAGKTALLVTCDHGRGSTLADWTNHGEDVAGAEGIWIALMGPGTPAMGIRKDVNVTQSQVAATIAGLVGHDYRAAVPKAAAALPDIRR